MSSPAAMPPTPHDAFDLYWNALIDDARHDILVIEPGSIHPTVGRADAPVGFHNLHALLGSVNVVRMPIRNVYGVPAHAYGLGYWGEGHESKTEFDAQPENRVAIEFLSRQGVTAIIRGPLVIVKGDALDPRDTQPAMVDANADTMPELERDHARNVGPQAEAEMARLRTAMEGQMIPAVLSSAPSLERICWLLRTVLIGIDTDIVSHAAMNELCVKEPLVAQSIAALWTIQGAHFAGALPELSADAEVDGPPTAPKPAGFSDLYHQVLH